MSRRLLFLLGLVLLVMPLLILLLLWLISPACTSISEEGFEGVIFSGERAAVLLGFMLTNDRAADAYWTPTKAEIIDMEQQLDMYVQEKMPTLATQLSTYNRQYFGFVRDGRQLVMIVGYCKPVSIDWRQELVSIPVAAGCYFEAQYDIVTDDFLYVWKVQRGKMVHGWPILRRQLPPHADAKSSSSLDSFLTRISYN